MTLREVAKDVWVNTDTITYIKSVEKWNEDGGKETWIHFQGTSVPIAVTDPIDVVLLKVN